MIRIVINGSILGGKNHVQITRRGHRYPNPAWAAWRDQAVMQVRQQIIDLHGFKMFTKPVSVDFWYFAGDKRRRDMPAIVDAVWHVLEKAGVVADDSLLWITTSHREYKKDSCGVALYLETEEERKQKAGEA